MTDYIYVLFAVFMASFLKGLTGMGFSTLCVPLLCLRFPITTAMPIVIIPSVISNLTVMREAGDFKKVLMQFKLLYIAVFPGLVFGLFILNNIKNDDAKLVLGITLLLYSIWGMAKSDFRLNDKNEKLLKIPTGFLTGLINGVTGSQVMPLLPYMLSVRLSTNELVQAVNISFTMSSFVMLTGLSFSGFVNIQVIFSAVVSLISVFVGVKIGAGIRRRVKEGMFKKFVLIFLMIAALLMIF